MKKKAGEKEMEREAMEGLNVLNIDRNVSLCVALGTKGGEGVKA